MILTIYITISLVAYLFFVFCLFKDIKKVERVAPGLGVAFLILLFIFSFVWPYFIILELIDFYDKKNRGFYGDDSR